MIVVCGFAAKLPSPGDPWTGDALLNSSAQRGSQNESCILGPHVLGSTILVPSVDETSEGHNLRWDAWARGTKPDKSNYEQ